MGKEDEPSEAVEEAGRGKAESWPEEGEEDGEQPAGSDEDYDVAEEDDEDCDISEDDAEPASEDTSMSSDWEDKGARHAKRRSRKKVKAPPPRPENAMTRKLRSNGPTPEELERQRMQEEQARLKTQQRAARAGAAANGSGRQARGGSPDAEGREQEQNGDEDGASGQDDDSELSEQEPQAEPKREVDEQKAQADLEAVHAMWEFASVIEFLFRFRYHLSLETVFTVDMLADAIVRSPGPGLLAQLHMELLAGILSNPKTLSPATWTAHFANRLRHEWLAYSGRPAPPFKAVRGEEAHCYAELASTDRVLALKALCEVRLDREDLRAVTDAAVASKPAAPAKAAAPAKPPKPPPAPPSRTTRVSAAPSAAGPGPGRPPGGARRAQRGTGADGSVLEPHEVRKEPLGVDSSGITYWLLDWMDTSQEDATNYGVHLYREQPAVQVKASPDAANGDAHPGSSKPGKASSSGKKLSRAAEERRRLAAYHVPPQAVAGRWERVASTTDEIEAIGSKLKRSAKQPDPVLASKILDVLVPSLRERQEQQERWAKAREKTAKQLGSMWGAGESAGRSMRNRKVVNYACVEYDDTILRAIRDSQREDREDSLPPPRVPKAGKHAASSAPAGEDAVRKRRARSSVPPEDGGEAEMTRAVGPDPSHVFDQTLRVDLGPSIAEAAPGLRMEQQQELPAEATDTKGHQDNDSELQRLGALQKAAAAAAAIAVAPPSGDVIEHDHDLARQEQQIDSAGGGLLVAGHENGNGTEGQRFHHEPEVQRPQGVPVG